MEIPKKEQSHWARTGNAMKSSSSKLATLSKKLAKPPCSNPSLKSPQCFIKITGSRYNGTFLLNIDDNLDDAIYQTMRDIEVSLEEQADPLGKPRVSPKNCLSSVFRCFGPSEFNNKAICGKKKHLKAANKPAECSLTATINKSDLKPLMSSVQSKSHDSLLENNDENVMREVVDVFRTTLDQFCNSQSSAFGVAASRLTTEPKEASSEDILRKETYKTAKHHTGKKVSFIKFSQEEVLVIQPPRTSVENSQEIEVGIEVKPKITAANVGQSINIAKDKVLIGVHDGRGVLQISDGVPKRSLQMVLEEGVNGRPSMKLCLKEEDTNGTDGNIPRPNHKKNDRESIRASKETDGTVDRGKRKTAQNLFQGNTKIFKSVESQVSWALLKHLNISSGTKQMENLISTQSESTQCNFNDEAISHYRGSNLPFFHCAEEKLQKMNNCVFLSRDDIMKGYEHPAKMVRSRINRTPYLVHTLYEPRSLNDSSYIESTTDRASSNCSFSLRVSPFKKFEMTEKLGKRSKKSFSSSSENSNSTKCTRIFRDIGRIRNDSTNPIIKKDVSMSTSEEQDFETILKTLCGSSYLYHQPTPPKICTDSKEIFPPRNGDDKKQEYWTSMSFDQWTQTDIRDNAQISFDSHDHRREEKSASEAEYSVVPNYCDIPTIGKTGTRSNVSVSVDEASLSSVLEDELSFGSSDNNKADLVSPLDAVNVKQNIKETCERNDKTWITGKAKSFVGQQIFAAIEQRASLPKLYETIEKASIGKAYEENLSAQLSRERNYSVLNMALYGGPNAAPLSDIAEDENENEAGKMMTTTCFVPVPRLVEESTPQGDAPSLPTSWSNFPVRAKSRSCQNLLTLSGSRSMDNIRTQVISATGPRAQKLRYPLLTKTDSHEIPVNVCGVFNIRQSKDDLEKTENFQLFPDNYLPPNIKSLLLPDQQLDLFSQYDHIPTICCNHVQKNFAGYGNVERVDTADNWCAYESNAVFSMPLQKNLIHKTLFVIKTAVKKKFNDIFRKLHVVDSGKKKKPSTENDITAYSYVAIPLKKKSENTQLNSII